jgi:hypothetical protein
MKIIFDSKDKFVDLNFPKIIHKLVYEPGKNGVFAIDAVRRQVH